MSETALSAAESTFAEFRDYPSSHYYVAPGLSPEETWNVVGRQLARVNGVMVLEAEARGTLGPADFHAIHRAIFEPVFAADTLLVRQYEDDVEFPAVLGSRDQPRLASMRGVSGRSLGKALKEIAGDLNHAVEARDKALRQKRQRTIRDATRPAAKAFGRLLAAHPWMDGNLRSAYPVLSFALMRLGLLAVAWRETEEFNWCLGQAMRRDHRNVEPLAAYLAEVIQASDTP